MMQTFLPNWFFFLSFLHIPVLKIAPVNADNPTSIVKPYDGPDPGYLIAECTSGLGNRLRVLAAYMYVAKYKFGGAHTVFIWDKNDACPGHFLSIFEPIPEVVFATNSSRYVLDKHAKIVYENSYAVYNWIMQMNQIPRNRFGFPTWAESEYQMYPRYFPTREVMLKATDFVARHDICNASAMHMRTTDLDRQMGKGKRISIESYFAYVDSRPAEEKIFLLTDSPDTQRTFINKYGADRILVYSDIPAAEDQLPLFITKTAHTSSIGAADNNDSSSNSQTTSSDNSNAVDMGGSSFLGAGAGGGKGGRSPRGRGKGRMGFASRGRGGRHPMGLAGALLRRNMTAQPLAEEHRFTTLEHTLIDVIIAAHARDFKPSPFSSLSDVVRMFEHIGKQDRGWCS